MTIEELATMTQKGVLDMKTRLVHLVESVLTVVQNIEGRVNEMHTAIRIDMPDLRDRVEILETDMEKVKETVKIPA